MSELYNLDNAFDTTIQDFLWLIFGGGLRDIWLLRASNVCTSGHYLAEGRGQILSYSRNP